MKKRTLLLLTLMATAAALAVPASAADLSGLVTFTSGTPARAASVNGNFSLLRSALADTRIGVVAVPASAFVPMNALASYQRGGYYLENTGASGAFFVAPVYLPHGATITRVTSRWYDTNDTYDVKVDLVRNGGAITSADSTSANGDGTTATTTFLVPTMAVVDNLLYNYGLSVFLQPDPTYLLHIKSVFIEYTYALN